LEKESLKEILIKTMKSMISCKIIAWCGTIELCKKWKNIFEKEFNFKFKYYIDHSKIDNNDYYSFRNINSNAILFCANKHREGSDIPKLDACLFLDKIKSRGIIPFIQSIGRVLRKDNNLPNKNKGIIIDSLLKTDDYEKTVINKIFEYYNALNNISNIY
jgi:predicted helicase